MRHLFWFLLLVPSLARAHTMRAGALRIDEEDATRSIARWTTTVPNAAAVAQFPTECRATPEGRVTLLVCPGGLAGKTVTVAGLGAVLNEATVVVRFRDGRTAAHLVTAEEPSWVLPAVVGPVEIGLGYLRLGVVHIATGADHLLFLVLLVLLLRRPGAVLLAETAFTLSHSIAFAATALGWIRVPPAPAEACIALSLVLLALDVRAEPAASRFHGAALALVFGLVHGLGFAGGLRELGVPDDHAAWALVGFGAGVEIGQVAFLGLVLGAVALVTRIPRATRALPLVATGIGALATAWLFERLAIAF